MTDLVPVRRALISLSDKSGLDELAAGLGRHNIEIVSTGGTAAMLRELDTYGGSTTLELRKKLAAKAFALTAAYDSTISQWFAFADQGERFPESWAFASKLKMGLRYGENPHQQAALYVPIGPASRGVAQAEQLQGKELSYNNLNDANAALELAAEFRDGPPTVVIVKHANPCGVASRDSLVDAW